jgi:hypothetical protein
MDAQRIEMTVREWRNILSKMVGRLKGTCKLLLFSFFPPVD